jgi:hypothetical protein
MCVRGGICIEGGMPYPAADGRRVPARTPPPPAPRHDGSFWCSVIVCVYFFFLKRCLYTQIFR